MRVIPICAPAPDCGCDDFLSGYSLVGRSYTNSQTSFIVPCPPGYTCGPGWPVIVPVVIHWNPPPPPSCPGDCPPGQGSILRLHCCQSDVVRQVPFGVAQSDYDAIVVSMLNECAAQQAICDATRNLPQKPKPRSDKQCVSCGDVEDTMTQVNPLPTGLSIQSNQLCVAAGMFSAATKSDANAQATAFVSQALTDALMDGKIQCAPPAENCVDAFSYVPPDCPCDLGVVDNTIVGTATPTLPATNDVNFVFGAASYSITYTGGAVNTLTNCGFDSNNYDSYTVESDPFSFSTGLGYWVVSTNSALTPSKTNLLNNGGGFGSYGFISNLSGAPGGCGPISLATFEGLVTADPGQPAFADHFGGTFTIHYESGVGLGAGSAPNPSWEIRRVKTDCIAPPSRLRINASDYSDLLPILVNANAPAAGTVVWDATFPNFFRVSLFSDWEWDTDVSGGALKVNGKQLSIQTKTYHSTAAQPTVSGCAWICAVTFSGGTLPWVGYGGNACSPEGIYLFSEILNGWTLSDRITDVVVATDSALPSNTLAANALTATANGAFPTVDGVGLAPADRILVKDEADGSKNGIYEVTSLGSGGTPWILTRTADQDTSLEVFQGVFTRATAGTMGTACYFRLVTPAVVLNTTALEWTEIPAQIRLESF